MEDERDTSRRWKHTEGSRFLPGDRVRHVPADPRQTSRGEGIVLEEWGAWVACRSCWLELARRAALCACGKATLRDWQGMVIPNTIVISGEGIYEVDFEGGRWSVSQEWLVKIEEKK